MLSNKCTSLYDSWQLQPWINFDFSLFSKFIENCKPIQVHALSLNGMARRFCLFYVAPLAPVQQFTHPHGIVWGEQMSNIHFILELQYLTLAIKIMVIPPQCMVNDDVKYSSWWDCLSPEFILMNNYSNKIIDTKLVAIFPRVTCTSVNSSLIENNSCVLYSLIFLYVTMSTLLLLLCTLWVRWLKYRQRKQMFVLRLNK